MNSSMTRRQFMIGATAISTYAVAARQIPTSASPSSALQRVLVRVDDEIGLIRPEFHGQFAEHLGSCVYGGLWVGPNSKIPNVNGYRKQAVDYLKELGVPVLRWPGGCYADDYHWRDGIGPRESRKKTVNIHWGGYVEDGSFGTHEFIGLCRLLGAEPYLAGNVGSGTPDELRNWVEYCNQPSGSTLAEERAKNGSPEPFHVKFWGVGNENWGCGGNMRPEVYADHFRRFAVYVREFGGTRPFMIASGPNGNDQRWTRGFLDGLTGGRPDAIGMHFYEGGGFVDVATNFTPEHMNMQMAQYQLVEDAIIQQRALIDGYGLGRGPRRLNLMLDEWGVWDKIPAEDEKKYGKLWMQSTMRSAVAAGLGLNVFNRQADKLYMCNIAQIVNVLQSMLLTDGPEGEHCVRTTTYHAFSLFKPHRGKTAVKTETPDATPLPPNFVRGGAAPPSPLSASASKADGQIVISVVNPRTDTDWQIDCTLRGATAKSATAQILHDTDLNAANTFDQPDRLMPKSHPVRVEGGRVLLDLPRLSVATVTVQTA
jgi:alpha-L-arabinofuranosidase